MSIRTASLVVLLPLAAFSQEFRARLSGVVTDPAGAAIPDATITARSAGTGAVSSTTSGADGSYQLPFLNPGQFVVTAEKAGFRKAVREGVTLQVSERAVLDFSMEIGEVTQSVTVSADTASVETETADRGLSIENNRVLNTPLQGRNIFANAWSAPGVIVTAAVQRLRPFDILGSSSMAVSGGQPYGNEVLIDGVSNLAGARQVAYVPQVEATGEFKVQTTAYDAQYGWTTGGVVNIATKSGTNTWHGAAYYFMQNTVLNANTFEANRAGIPRSSSHIHTFGGDVGGPIKRDRLFGTFSYENIRQIIPDPFVSSVPTDLQKQGDFSQTYWSQDAAGNLLVQGIYDPFSTRDAGGGRLVRDMFPGNRIPASRLNAIGAKVLSFIPAGNVPGNAITRLGNLTSS